MWWRHILRVFIIRNWLQTFGENYAVTPQPFHQRRDTRHNDNQHNDTRHNDNQNNDTRHNDNQNNDTRHNGYQHNYN